MVLNVVEMALTEFKSERFTLTPVLIGGVLNSFRLTAFDQNCQLVVQEAIIPVCESDIPRAVQYFRDLQDTLEAMKSQPPQKQ